MSEVPAPSTFLPSAGAHDWAGQSAGATPPSEEHRRAPRINMFIAASADLDGRTTSARVRNMSQTGALVELADPIRIGARVVLKRGDNVASGWVVWSEGHRCGVAFADLVSVSAWMGRPIAREEGQRRVDMIQAQIRAGSAEPHSAPLEPARPPLSAAALQQRLSEELVTLKRIIDKVGEDLAGEPAMLDRHAGSMQQFDIVSQTLGHLARLLIAPDPVGSIGNIGMDSLRKRLERE